MQHRHRRLDLRQLVEELTGRSLGEFAVLVDRIVVIQRAHLVEIVAVGCVAVGMDQLADRLLVEQCFELLFEVFAHHRSPFDARTLASSGDMARSEAHTSELQSLMRISYAVFCLKNKKSK